MCHSALRNSSQGEYFYLGFFLASSCRFPREGWGEKNTHATFYEDLITTLACSHGIPEVALLYSFGILFTQRNEAGVCLPVCEGVCESGQDGDGE